jgi:hypothetical protein
VERKFATLFGRARSMLNRAKLSQSKRNELWAEAANTATMLDNITVSTNEKSSYQKFYNKDPKWMRNLKRFGEIGIVTDHEHKKIRGKLDDRGFPCMFVGYSDNHTSNVYRMYDLQTRGIKVSRDITWLNKFYGEYVGLKNTAKVETQADDSSDEEDGITDQEGQSEDDNYYQPIADSESENEDEKGSDSEGEQQQPPQNNTGQRGSRVQRELRQLQTFYNPDANQELEKLSESVELVLNTILSGGNDPYKFNEAWDHPEPTHKKGWREGISKEFGDMKD